MFVHYSLTLRPLRLFVGGVKGGVMAELAADGIDQLRVSLGRRLVDLRRAAALTQRELAKQTHVDRSFVSHAENGRHLPERRFWELADCVLDAKGELVAAYGSVQEAVREVALAQRRQQEELAASAGLSRPWTAAGTLQVLRVVTDPGAMDPMGRRMFLLLAGEAATAPAHQWLLARPGEDVARPGRTVVSATFVDRLDAVTAELRRMDDEVGGASLLEVVRGHLRHVVDLIENSRYSETVGRRLHATAAELLRLAGWTCFEANRHPQAQRYWIAALHAANTAGDRALGANILGFMSAQARDLGQIRESVTLAETARMGYGGAAPAVAAILDLRAAEAHALDGAINECRRALDSMFDRLNDTPSSTGEPGWSYWLDAAQAHACAGVCYLHVRDLGRARSHLRSALSMHRVEFPRDATVMRIRLAETYVRQDHPDLDQALALGTEAVDALSGTINSTQCVKRLAPLVNGLARFNRRPAVREFTERATALLTLAG